MSDKLTPDAVKAAQATAKMADSDLYYLRAVARRFAEFADALDGAESLTIGSEAFYDEMDWLDDFIHRKTAPDLATAYLAMAEENERLRKRVEAADALAEHATALGLREVVAGWNGEGREKPYTPHPSHLRAKITTTCGTVYGIDEALAAYRATEGQSHEGLVLKTYKKDLADRIEALEAELATARALIATLEGEQARADRLAEKLEKAIAGLEDVAGVGFDAPMTWAGTDAEWERKRAIAMQWAAKDALREIAEMEP